MRKFEYKYKVDEEKRTVVAMSTFAGKAVSGVARCDPSDTFNVDTGKKLAAARCSVKIAEKRLKRARYCSTKAAEALIWWTARRAQMENYEFDANVAYNRAIEELKDLEKTFRT